MPRYDARRFSPPAPVAHVTLSNLRRRLTSVRVPMLIDSGADVTLLPRAVATRLKIAPGPQYELLGFDGTPSLAATVRLKLTWLGCDFVGQFLLIDDAVGIIGRNILNAVSVGLDGPHLTWHRL